MLHLAGGEALEVDSEVAIPGDMNEENSMNFLRFVGWEMLFFDCLNLFYMFQIQSVPKHVRQHTSEIGNRHRQYINFVE